MKKILFFISLIYFLSISYNGLMAQQGGKLTLDSCIQAAMENYPLVKQFQLIEQTNHFTLENISKGYFPQISINGQISYQSDVTQIQMNGTLPPQLNIDFPTMDKDQYKIYGEVTQPITDLATIYNSKKIIVANTAVEKQKIEVEMQKIKEKVIQIFLGIKLLDEQLSLNELLQKDIRNGIEKSEKWVQNGIAIKSNVDLLRAELIKAQQYRLEIESAKKIYLEMLSKYIGQEINEEVVLVIPEEPQINDNFEIRRPELTLFTLQHKVVDTQKKLLTIKTIPRFSIFFQTGYGRPGLNMLSPDFDFYYIGGLRLQWNLSTFYTYGKEKKIFDLQQNSIDIQRNLFLFNNNLLIIQQQKEIEKYQKMISNDKQIIKLRENIKISAEIQLAEGTISTTDYITFITAEERAKQDIILHQMQLLIAKYQLNSILGK